MGFFFLPQVLYKYSYMIVKLKLKLFISTFLFLQFSTLNQNNVTDKIRKPFACTTKSKPLTIT